MAGRGSESLFLDTSMAEIKRHVARLKPTRTGSVKAARLSGYIVQFDGLSRNEQERIDTWVVHAYESRGLGVQGAFELAMVIYNLSRARGFTFADMERYCDRPRTRMIG